MKRKTLFLLSILTISATLLSGCKSADSVDNSETIETTAIESEATEGTETVEETETETESTSLQSDIPYEEQDHPDVNPEDVDPKTTQMDGDTQAALSHVEMDEIEAKYGSMDAYLEYVKSQGADYALGWCWIYYTGKGAGNQESYAVYMKEDSPRYGEVFHLGDYLPGGDFFIGANNEEHGIADNRKLLRKSEKGELGEGTTVTQNEDGTIHIVID
ncbi:MAG: hypothetical protein SPE81_07480 [Agathobacter sp.]|nr:hypothetical protein [Agathobacter sp.]